MIRTIALAATAATLIALPALAAELSPTQVRLDGRTQTQIKADVTAIAARLCAEKFADDQASVDACISDSVRATMKKVVARGAYVWAVAADD